jgi:small subunit ribosomal protein S3
MGQKVHPLGFRIGITQEHKSKWFAGNNDYANSILEDQFLRNFLDQTYKDAGIIEINIERKLDQIQISIQAARPGIFLGQDSGSLDKLRYRLEQKLTSFRNRSLNRSAYPNSNRNTQKPSIALNINEIENPNLEAAFLADFLIEQLEKRAPFRRAIRQAVQRAERANVLGIKIAVSGRLNGAEIARTEWVREGRVPLQTLRADIDYVSKTAQTIYGILGIKIWIFRGEKV